MLVDLPARVTAFDVDPDAGNHSGNGVPAFDIRNGLGEYAYGGAAPPAADRPHHYYFVGRAVDGSTRGLASSASAAVVNVMLAFHTLSRAALVLTFSEHLGASSLESRVLVSHWLAGGVLEQRSTVLATLTHGYFYVHALSLIASALSSSPLGNADPL